LSIHGFSVANDALLVNNTKGLKKIAYLALNVYIEGQNPLKNYEE
jgi:hypothetical protein